MVNHTLFKGGQIVSKRGLKISKNLYTYLYLFGLFGGFSAIKLSDQGNSISFIAFPILYVTTIYKLICINNSVNYLTLFRAVFLMFTGLIISIIFSYDPLGSLPSLISLIFNCLFGYWLSIYYSRDEVFLIILNILKYMLAISIVFIIIDPSIVIYYDPLDRLSVLGLPNFKGIFPHKIQAGIYNAIGFIISYFYYVQTRKTNYIYTSMVFVIGTMASGSSLALTTLTLTVISNFVFGNAIKKYGISGVKYLSVFLLFIVYIFFLSGLPVYILDLLGRDLTLTGRTVIWEFGIEYFQKNPLVGGGYDTFFNENEDSPANELWNKMVDYKAPSFHNGYIEIISEAGIIGGIPILLFFISSLKHSILMKNKLGFLIIVMCIICNFGSALLVKPNLFFFTYIMYNYFLFKRKLEFRKINVVYSTV